MASVVWKEFTKLHENEAKCNICKKVLKCAGGSTSGLARHLCTHRSSSSGSEGGQAGPSSKQSKSIANFFSARKPLNAILAELAALDGFSFNAIAKSAYLRQSLEKDGFKLPKDPSEIAKMVQGYAAETQNKLVDAFQLMVRNAGTRFSLTMDEYTSIQNKRFMNINLHTECEHWNLGVFRIEGSMTAEKVVELMNEKLATYSLNLEDHIMCATTDGASVMVKYGKLVLPEHQLCLCHAVHLAVMGTLYVKKDRSAADEDEDESDADEEMGEEDDQRAYLSRATMESSVEKVIIRLN